MNQTLNRMFVAAAVIGAVSLAGARVQAVARQQTDPKQQDLNKPGDPKKTQEAPAPGQKPPDKPPKKPKPQSAGQQQQPPPARGRQQQPPPPQPQGPQRQAPPQVQPRAIEQRLPASQQQALIGRQHERLQQYGVQLDQQQRLVPQQVQQLQRQNRPSQSGFVLRYSTQLGAQRSGLGRYGAYNYDGDPFFYTPANYRYTRGGRDYETNEHGATVLRRAVNYGYQEGFEAGQADRQDRWQFDYQGSFAYQDGNYGYLGFYVDRDEYNYYFREGFRRGYDDGYYGRFRYGVRSTEGYSVLPPVLTLILNFQRKW